MGYTVNEIQGERYLNTRCRLIPDQDRDLRPPDEKKMTAALCS